MIITMSPEEVKMLVSALSLIADSKKYIVLRQDSSTGIGRNLYVSVLGGEETDITDVSVW